MGDAYTAAERALLGRYFSEVDAPEHADVFLVSNLPPEVAAVDPGRVHEVAAEMAVAARTAPPTAIAPTRPEDALETLVVRLEDAERILIRNALRQSVGNREKAASALGISERTLYRKIAKFGEQVTG